MQNNEIGPIRKTGRSNDPMQERLAPEAGEEVLDGELGHAAAGLDGRAAQMGGDDDVGHGQKGVVSGQWLGLGHVEGRGGDAVLRRCASVNASVSTTAPRAMLIRVASGFISESSRVPMLPRVSSVSGTQSIT